MICFETTITLFSCKNETYSQSSAESACACAYDCVVNRVSGEISEKNHTCFIKLQRQILKYQVACCHTVNYSDIIQTV